ncbi:hypothetical protein [Nostoc sp.]|uniref:hypothetical protein n=1 Tax=Nostoc sp. TaxID=1180 RepID=UPI002FF55899
MISLFRVALREMMEIPDSLVHKYYQVLALEKVAVNLLREGMTVEAIYLSNRVNTRTSPAITSKAVSRKLMSVDILC